MSIDDPRSLPLLTDYEKSLIESLRQERRQKLGIETAAAASKPEVEEPHREDEIPIAPPPAPDQPLQETQPALVEAVSSEREIEEPAPSLNARHSSAPPAQRFRPRPTSIMLGSLLAVVLAAGTLAVLNSPTNTRKIAVETPPQASQPSGARLDQPPREEKAPVQDDAAPDLETMFANHPADRKNGRAEFRKALASPTLDSGVRQLYLEVSGNHTRLRSSPAESAPVSRTLRRGAYVRLEERPAGSHWCQVRLPEGRAGWMKCDSLKPIAEPRSEPGLQARKEPRRR